jgi:predicted CoA-binding protein
MTSTRDERRRAYEVAKTLHRAFYEIYYPVPASGARPALPLTEEASAELVRLAAKSEEARLAWEASRRD